ERGLHGARGAASVVALRVAVVAGFAGLDLPVAASGARIGPRIGAGFRRRRSRVDVDDGRRSIRRAGIVAGAIRAHVRGRRAGTERNHGSDEASEGETQTSHGVTVILSCATPDWPPSPSTKM